MVLDHRDSIGDSAIAGDLRWAGSYGVNVDFVAKSHCAVETILIEDMKVLHKHSFGLWKARAITGFDCRDILI